MTFAEQDDGAGLGRRERSLVGERASEIEGRLRAEDGEGEDAMKSSSMVSSEGGGENLVSAREKDSDVQSGTSTMGTNSEIVEN